MADLVIDTDVVSFGLRYFATEAMCNAWAELVWNCKQQDRAINSADAWIASTTIVLSIPLVTHNVKDFRHVPGLKLVTFEDQ